MLSAWLAGLRAGTARGAAKQYGNPSQVSTARFMSDPSRSQAQVWGRKPTGPRVSSESLQCFQVAQADTNKGVHQRSWRPPASSKRLQ